MCIEVFVYGVICYMIFFVNCVIKRKEIVVNENRVGEGGLGRINFVLMSLKSF